MEDAAVDALGAVQEFDQEEGRDFDVGEDEADVVVEDPMDDNADHDDQEEEPCAAVPGVCACGGVAELLDDQEEDQDGEKLA